MMDRILAWTTVNKDALLAVAAIISSVVAFAAVIVGPRTQRWIAKTTFRMNRDHQWIADFRQALAEAGSRPVTGVSRGG